MPLLTTPPTSSTWAELSRSSGTASGRSRTSSATWNPTTGIRGTCSTTTSGGSLRARPAFAEGGDHDVATAHPYPRAATGRKRDQRWPDRADAVRGVAMARVVGRLIPDDLNTCLSRGLFEVDMFTVGSWGKATPSSSAPPTACSPTCPTWRSTTGSLSGSATRGQLKLTLFPKSCASGRRR